MARSRSLRRGEAQLLADLEATLRPAGRPRLAGLLWRWRYESLLAGLTGGAVAFLVHLIGGEWTVICASALIGGLGPWPPRHRRFLAALWRLTTPHRLHAGFVQARIQARNGRLPLILRTRTEPFGERVRVWCPAGTSAEDMESAQAILRAACWATDLRIERDQRHAHLVTVDVIRRPAA